MYLARKSRQRRSRWSPRVRDRDKNASPAAGLSKEGKQNKGSLGAEKKGRGKYAKEQSAEPYSFKYLLAT